MSHLEVIGFAEVKTKLYFISCLEKVRVGEWVKEIRDIKVLYIDHH